MSVAQKIKVSGGSDLAVIEWSEYEKLLEFAEELEDIRDYYKVKAESGEIVPHAVVKRLADGENPFRVWREHRGLTTRELSDKCGITVAHLSQVETGKRDPSLSLLKRLSKHLNVDIDELIWD